MDKEPDNLSTVRHLIRLHERLIAIVTECMNLGYLKNDAEEAKVRLHKLRQWEKALLTK